MNDQECWLHNLSVGIAKAGGVGKFCTIIQMNISQYYSAWNVKPPTQRDVYSIKRFAEFMNVSVDKLFTEKLSQPKNNNTAEVEKVFTAMDKINTLRQQYNLKTLLLWKQHIQELVTILDNDWNGLDIILDRLKPVEKIKRTKENKTIEKNPLDK